MKISYKQNLQKPQEKAKIFLRRPEPRFPSSLGINEQIAEFYGLKPAYRQAGN